MSKTDKDNGETNRSDNYKAVVQATSLLFTTYPSWCFSDVCTIRRVLDEIETLNPAWGAILDTLGKLKRLCTPENADAYEAHLNKIT